MEWRDRGIVVAVRPQGETGRLVSLLTEGHGRHKGLVRGQRRPVVSLGVVMAAHWRARLAEQLGTLRLEPERPTDPRVLADPPRLLALITASALIETTLAEREPHPIAFRALGQLLAALASDPRWPEAYVRFERTLLADLGFALDLRCCAVTGATDDLAFVSPRTGRAVSHAGAGLYRERLLPLPAFLKDGEGSAEEAPGAATPEAIAQGLRLTGHFLARDVFAALGQAPPSARARLLDALAPRKR